MKKRIAVIVRERQSEALRMSIGLTVLDDEVDIFVLDKKLEESETVKFNLEMIGEMGLKMFTNVRENAGMEFMALKVIAGKLLFYDHILPY